MQTSAEYFKEIDRQTIENGENQQEALRRFGDALTCGQYDLIPNPTNKVETLYNRYMTDFLKHQAPTSAPPTD